MEGDGLQALRKCSISRFPAPSTRKVALEGTTVVALYSATMAGPRSFWPAGKPTRSYSENAAQWPPDQTRRFGLFTTELLSLDGRVAGARSRPDSCSQSQSHKFDFAIRMAVAVAEMMVAMKFVHEVRRENYIQLETLSPIAKIGATLEVKSAAPPFVSKFPPASLSPPWP